MPVWPLLRGMSGHPVPVWPLLPRSSGHTQPRSRYLPEVAAKMDSDAATSPKLRRDGPLRRTGRRIVFGHQEAPAAIRPPALKRPRSAVALGTPAPPLFEPVDDSHLARLDPPAGGAADDVQVPALAAAVGRQPERQRTEHDNETTH